MGFGVWEEGVAGDYYRRGVSAGATLYRDAASMGSDEAEEFGKSPSRVLFDHGQCGRNFICVDVGVESGEDQFGGDTGGIG